MKVEDFKVGEIYKVIDNYVIYVDEAGNDGGMLIDCVEVVETDTINKRVFVNFLRNYYNNLQYCYNNRGVKIRLRFDINHFLEIIKDDIDIKTKTTPPQLESGMVVEIYNEKFLLIDDELFTVSTRREYDLKNQGWYSHLRNTTYKIKKDSINDYTDVISKVYKVKNPYYTQLTANPLFSPSNLELIWESEPIKTMTQSEIEKELGYKIKIDFIK